MIEMDWKDEVAKAATFVFFVVFPTSDVFYITHGDEEYDFLFKSKEVRK